jgi:hypothetical protein
MDYRVDEIALDDPLVEEEVETLIGEAFDQKLVSGRVRRNTAAPDRPPPLYVAATQQGEIIGFNAFIGHRLELNGEEIIAYQSCWTATSAKHRGKRIFQNLLFTAHGLLQQREVAFVFGFPNKASRPIFVGKLGYREIGSTKWQIPRTPFASSLFCRAGAEDLCSLHRNTVRQDDRALINLKRNEPESRVEQFELGGSLCWGVRRTRQFGPLRTAYVDLGGIALAQTKDLAGLIAGLSNKLGGAYVQLIATADAPYAELLRGVRPAATDVFIVHDLCRDTKEFRFNFFGGIRDVY